MSVFRVPKLCFENLNRLVRFEHDVRCNFQGHFGIKTAKGFKQMSACVVMN